MLAQPTGSATSLDLVSMSDVITAIALKWIVLIHWLHGN